MLACAVKDWRTVCELAAGPRCVLRALCGRALGLCQDRGAVWEGAAPDAANLLYHQSGLPSRRIDESSAGLPDRSVSALIHIYGGDCTGAWGAAVTTI